MVQVIRQSGRNIDANRLLAITRALRDRNLNVGWFESARYDDDTPVAGVAALHEFGSAVNKIPPRPFMRPTIADNQADWRSVTETGFRRVFQGRGEPGLVLELLGLRVSGKIRQAIAQLRDPPLSPVTLALRKQIIAGQTINRTRVRATGAAIAAGRTGPGELGDSSGINPKPLVFTAFMLNSLTYVVE